MNLIRRIYLAIPLTPVFWLMYMWVFFLSGHKEYSIAAAFAYSFLMSFVSAYCIVLFCCKWRSDHSANN